MGSVRGGVAASNAHFQLLHQWFPRATQTFGALHGLDDGAVYMCSPFVTKQQCGPLVMTLPKAAKDGR